MRRHVRHVFVFLLFAAICLLGCKPTQTQAPPGPITVAHAHDASGETCFICDPGKREKGRLWCKEHGRYEDRCWECHPELRDDARLYCEEHGLYEDECFLCDPTRGTGKAGGDGGADAGEVDGSPGGELFCNEHQVPEHQCGICQPELAAGLPVGASLLIRLASERSAELAGLSVGRPMHGEGSSTLPLLGEIRYDGNRLAKVTPLAGGVLARVDADLGQEVEAGEVLALVNAPAVAEAKARFVAAQADLQLAETALGRQELLQREEITSQQSVEGARADQVRAAVAVTVARQGLLNLGFSEADIEGSSGSATSALPLRSPFAGTVVRRDAVLGEAVRGDDVLFEIADLRQMWVELSVPEEVAAGVVPGTPIRVAVQARFDSIDGTITWVGPVIDERTRMVRARGVVPNSDRGLRQGMFAAVTAVLESIPDSLRLPASAVHRVDDLPFVFVRGEPDLFEARRVDVGDRLPSSEFVIRAGISPDDIVVLVGGFALKSALLASRLGAGCADD